MVDVVVEVGPRRRTFARAVEWPGWCRSGRTEDASLQALNAGRVRYAAVAAAAGYALPDGDVNVIEHLKGTAVTDFGAIASLGATDLAPLTPRRPRAARRAAGGDLGDVRRGTRSTTPGSSRIDRKRVVDGRP